MSTDKSILKSASLVSLGTLLSRILGFLRDMILARLFGVYTYAQAFVVAFKIPNLLRDFLGEGAANASFVPIFSEYRLRHTPRQFWELANVTLNLVLIALSALTLLGIVLSPFLVRIIAPGFIVDAEKLEKTIRLLRSFFPYLLLMGLSAYASGLLNSLGHFSLPAFSPCLLNISLILFAISFKEGLKGLVLGVLVGGLLQVLVQVPLLYKKGFRLQLFRRFRHPQTNLMLKLLAPRLLSTSIYQLNNFVDTIFASLSWIVGEGGVAGLYFAYRLILFPIGIISNSFAQVLLPTFSVQALNTDYKGLERSLFFGLSMTFFLILPFSSVFMLGAFTIIQALFGGGRFDGYSIKMSSQILSFYSLGLFAYAGNRILQSCFFALKDTLTPTKVSFLSLLTNTVLNAILIFPLKIRGIALATSLSGVISFFVLFSLLHKRLNFKGKEQIFFSFLRIFFASLGAGLVFFFLAQRFFIAEKALLKFMSLSFISLGTAISYIGFCLVFKVKELKELWSWISRKR